MPANQSSITIVTPCYNESGVVAPFLESLGNILVTLPYHFHIVVVNDCSTDNTLAQLQSFRFGAGNIDLKIINLKSNAGHQAAIYEGLLFANTTDSNHFIVMDADGQDAPAIIPDLLVGKDVDLVHVVRGKRNESALFRCCYWLYKKLFKLATGQTMNYGNFCLFSRKILDIAVSSGFSHFPAFLAKQKVNRRFIVATREKRIGGTTKMGFVKLVRYGLKSFTEYWNCKSLSGL